jgi:hypothetical protein
MNLLDRTWLIELLFIKLSMILIIIEQLFNLMVIKISSHILLFVMFIIVNRRWGTFSNLEQE